MSCPFPGMDPWLEQAGIWKNLHTSLITGLRDFLVEKLRPRYYVDIEQWTYITRLGEEKGTGEPDVHITHITTPRRLREVAVGYQVSRTLKITEPIRIDLGYEQEMIRFLEVRKPDTGEVITVIEILSPKNKRRGEGRARYLQKRENILLSRTHFVEIDLLRNWEPMVEWTTKHQADYRILVSRAEERPEADLYPFTLRDPIPSFHLPLLPGDEEPIVDLTEILHQIYDRAGYAMVLNYAYPPDPVLSKEDAVWAAQWLKRQESESTAP